MSSLPCDLPDGPAALVIGHPGHELRVHGWMEWAQPGTIFGRWSDQEVYEALLHHARATFTDVVDGRARAIVYDVSTQPHPAWS